MGISSKNNSEGASGESLDTQKAAQSFYGKSLDHFDLTHASGPRFQAIHSHAKGGLGEVFRAKDNELQRDVALKEIQSKYAHDPASQHRFIAEAMVTGSLDHPGIVPVYGLGRYDDGRPYYAMRFISGNSFKQEVDQFYKTPPVPRKAFYNSREYRGWLRRLIDCCNAMQYAHERNVLHRDLKPDNVMLGRHGETLIVDWGLAKVGLSEPNTPTNDANSEKQPMPFEGGLNTSLGKTLGTPMYMSPEQAMGLHDQLTPVSDIYSLGAILFNISSGQHPVQGRDVNEVIANVRLGKVRDLREAMPTVPRSIASICRKAMSFSPADRYSTAVEMADDLDRWLSDEQVLAHAAFESWMEKTGRWIRRHRTWALATAVALIVISIVSVLAAFWVDGARKAETMAKLEAVDHYRRSLKTMDTWLVQSDPALMYFPAMTPVRKRLLEMVAEDYAKLAMRQSNSAELELQRAVVLIRLGDVSRLQQKTDVAQKHYRDAVQILERISQLDNEELSNLAVSEIAKVYNRAGMIEANANEHLKAKQQYSLAIDLLDKHLAVSNDPASLRTLVSTFVNTAEVSLAQADSDTAQTESEQAIEYAARLKPIVETEDHVLMARAYLSLGRCLVSRGRDRESLEYFESTRSCLEDSGVSNSDNPELIDLYTSVLTSLMAAYGNLGHVDEQVKCAELAVSMCRELYVAMPDMPHYTYKLAKALTNLALQRMSMDQYSLADEPQRQSLNLLDQLERKCGENPYFSESIITALDSFGQMSTALGDIDAAREAIDNAIRRSEIEIDQNSKSKGFVEKLALALCHASHVSELPTARLFFDDGIKIFIELADSSPETLRFQSNLGYAYFEYGRRLLPTAPDEAREKFSLARETWMAMPTRDVATTERLAWLLATGNFVDDEARNEAVFLSRQCVEESPRNPKYLATHGLSLLRDQQIEQAEAFFSEIDTGAIESSIRLSLVKSAIAIARGDEKKTSGRLQAARTRMLDEAPQDRDLLYLESLLTVESR